MHLIRHHTAVTRQQQYLGDRRHGLYDTSANCSTGPQERAAIPQPPPTNPAESVWETSVDPDTGRTLRRRR